MNTSTLNDLMDISIEGPDLKDFSPNEAIDSWWKACGTSRRTNQHARKEYRPRSSSSGQAQSSSATKEEESSEESLTLTDWDN